MNISLIVPLCFTTTEHEDDMPYLFQFTKDGTLLCVKSILGLDLSKFKNIYFTILSEYNQKYNLSTLLKLQFRKLGIKNAHIIILRKPTNSQVETVYKTIKRANIKGALFIKDSDGYFRGDFTLTNGIAIYPLDKLEMVNPSHKSYIQIDDQFYITNIIERKIISRYFNAGGYIFESADIFCQYYNKLSMLTPLYMSHVIYAMLLDKIPFRPFEVENFIDWGNEKIYNYFKQ